MEPSCPSLVAALAAGAILLIVLGLARQLARGPGPGTPDPARDDAGQEPRGARAAGAVHRADPAAAGRRPVRSDVAGGFHVLHARRPRSAWRWPATRATCASSDWLGIKAIGAIVGGDPVLLPVRDRRRPWLPVRDRRWASASSGRCSATRSPSSGWVGASRSARRPSC